MNDDHITDLKEQLRLARKCGELVELEHVDGRHLYGYEIGMIGKDTFVISCDELDDVVVVPYYRVKSLDFI